MGRGMRGCELELFRRKFKPTYLAVFWARPPASPLADLMTGWTWMGNRTTHRTIRAD